MKYRLIAHPDGYAVAYFHASGGWVAQSMHCERTSAEREVERRNLQHQAALVMAASSLQQHREHAFTERRSARYFEPDQSVAELG